MGSDEEDFVFLGTPIEREEEIATRKKKAIAEASGSMRALPAWKQEVRDEDGLRRFHGAFTGGFSAGYYNTVGSKEGWTPQSFTSSRKNRAGVRNQSISDFLDEDERADLEGQSLSTSSQFDTFGFTAAEYSRKQAEKEQHQRPSIIPGPVPDELVIPVSESIGVNLLLKMGWRRGHSIKNLRASSDARREARKAFLAFSTNEKSETTGSQFSESEVATSLEPNDDIRFSESTPVYLLNPKQDLYGLGYDPFKHAPEFREKKRSRMSASKELGHRKPLSMKESLFGSKSGKIAPGFGIGALEELDIEDEDIYAGIDFEETYVEEEEGPSRHSTENRLRLTSKEHDALPGFRVASSSDYIVERFDPPKIPKDYVPRHKFHGPLETDIKAALSAPPAVPPPEDNNLKLLIEGFATLVSRCGKLFEDLSSEKNRSNPLFDFLRGGNGHDYYARRLWEEHQKRSAGNKLPLDGKSSQSMQKITAETRGRILGEKPLERRSSRDASAFASSGGGSFKFPSNLSDTFTKPESSQEAVEAVKPFKDDPAKQERFEQFLKEKYQGGLRSTDSSRVNSMSDAARALERLDFEAAAEALEKGKVYKPATERPLDFLAGALQFTSGGVERGKDAETDDTKLKKMYPKREEFHWRPAPLLCKRFDLPDPYMGKPPPAPRPKSKMESLVFLPDNVKAESSLGESLYGHHQAPNVKESNRGSAAKEPEIEVEVENVERPVDLYKAIFSDDSEDEEEAKAEAAEMSTKRQEEKEKNNEAAAKTLNRLIAGDFLESLGKELGLEVPPDAATAFPERSNPAKQMVEEEKTWKGKPEGVQSFENQNDNPRLRKTSEEEDGVAHEEEQKRRNRREKSRDRWSSETSGEERRRRRRRKRSKRDSSSGSESEEDSSDDYSSRDRHRARSRRKRRDKKKHSKHHLSSKKSSSSSSRHYH
ncbi:PREDICTED: G patch domain-containing protein TGH [Tarenaya hassleriana]|uniref:G patch domain-containing protein TGH n=1 Tax=Tarenaya hassleriana TaxID=28532 RepID=UPI00053C861A|nr:PREDICTED: G patch domain-containing protein TGH [Tarenaya hassleriana]